MRENPWEIHDVYDLIRDKTKIALTVKEAAKELGKSTRTIFRMIGDGRLTAEKMYSPYRNEEKFFWIIDPMSIARIQVRKEMELEQEAKKTSSRKSKKALKKDL